MKRNSGPLLAALAGLASNFLVATSAWALGLGEARVESYLHQPLEARIRLISRSEAELATVTAALASAEDFRVIGLDRAILTVPMTFEVVADLDDPHIRVRSREPMSEPVVQLVLEVVWASGRMLRQYTLFLDPPTIDAAAPLPGVSPSRSQASPEPEPLPEPIPEPELPADPGAASVPTPEDSTAGPDAASEVAVPESAEPVAVAPPPRDSVEGNRYGPVQRGETLWGIATRVSRQQGYSVNQLMLAIQQRNPGAFNRDNINSLRAGAVLRLPTRDEVLALGQREAMLEVQRQDLAWRSGLGTTPASAEELPVLADVATAEPEPSVDGTQPGIGDDPSAGSPAAGDPLAGGRLELVPPAADEALAGEAGTGNTGDENEEGAVSVVEELARTQEELANAQQENQYLNDRIEELEAELARRDPSSEDAGGVEDTALAELEERLQAERQAGDEEPVQVIPADEERPWLARWTPWVIGLVLLAVITLVWWLRRQRQDEDMMQEITEEAEGILRALGDGDDGSGDTSPDDDNIVTMESFKPPAARHMEEEAVELDADDPETKLDLARAYLSMGDLTAARRSLEEVLDSGDEEQVAEARRMMQEL